MGLRARILFLIAELRLRAYILFFGYITQVFFACFFDLSPTLTHAWVHVRTVILSPVLELIHFFGRSRRPLEFLLIVLVIVFFQDQNSSAPDRCSREQRVCWSRDQRLDFGSSLEH
ncbi:hypothetical protein B0O80DRAFT_472575 [Mortierella sp. GBAus27b]|nr:hypothetical protein B0O80DRAFT_472575 [Mortierella sp. GBAus27b]